MPKLVRHDHIGGKAAATYLIKPLEGVDVEVDIAWIGTDECTSLTYSRRIRLAGAGDNAALPELVEICHDFQSRRPNLAA